MFSLFEKIGIELEYMIVDRQTLAVQPICDKLMKKVAGVITDDFENGAISWSNELVSHVVELKCSDPATPSLGLADEFYKNIVQINDLLKTEGAMLMPTGAHPWMNPLKETQIWPYEYHEIYELYNKIFDCSGHGWANLQSMHINMPFNGDEEFGRLHAAIRVLMPFIPALTASTPLLDGKLTGFADSRLEVYRHNQDKIPSIAGSVVPEAVFTKADYYDKIFNPIIADIAPFDKENILDHHFLNSRGAIARFDRNAIELRIIDLQESPFVDINIALFIFETLHSLASGDWIATKAQMDIPTNRLADMFVGCVRCGSDMTITDEGYLALFGLKQPCRVGEFWTMVLNRVSGRLGKTTIDIIEKIIAQGSLSERIVRKLGANPSRSVIDSLYRDLAACLANNTMFE